LSQCSNAGIGSKLRKERKIKYDKWIKYAKNSFKTKLNLLTNKTY
jgi:hypothetical protein